MRSNSPQHSFDGAGHDAPVERPWQARVGKTLPAYSALTQFVVPVALVAVWIFTTGAQLADPIFVPSPADIWRSMQQMAPQLPEALASSVTMTLVGFLGGSLLGLGLGLFIVYSKIARELLSVILDFLRPVPTFALIPLFVLWFGLGRMPQIAIIMFGTSILIGLVTIEAVKNVPPIYIKAALTLGARRMLIYRTIILPAIFPHLMGAVRAAAAGAWGRNVAAEYIGAQTGLGYLMIIRSQYLDTAAIIGIIIIYALLAVALDAVIVAVQKPLTKWTQRNTQVGAVAIVLGSK
ncbi:ABC transporter permease [Pseudochelatococcus sp. B33]